MVSEQRESVTRGARLLDEKVPGWYRRVNLETLHMRDCSLCMLGQLFGHDVETALGAEVFGLPIETPEIAQQIKTVSKAYADGDTALANMPNAERLFNRTGFKRGKAALQVADFTSIGCGSSANLRCMWTEEIAERLAEDEVSSANSDAKS